MMVPDVSASLQGHYVCDCHWTANAVSTYCDGPCFTDPEGNICIL